MNSCNFAKWLQNSIIYLHQLQIKCLSWLWSSIDFWFLVHDGLKFNRFSSFLVDIVFTCGNHWRVVELFLLFDDLCCIFFLNVSYCTFVTIMKIIYHFGWGNVGCHGKCSIFSVEPLVEVKNWKALFLLIEPANRGEQYYSLWILFLTPTFLHFLPDWNMNRGEKLQRQTFSCIMRF